MRQHITADARIHGIITHGGDVPNVVPDFAQAEFFVRAATLAAMNELVEKVRRIAEGAALITGASLEFEMPEEPNADMITNYPMASRLGQHLDAVGLAAPAGKAGAGHGIDRLGATSATKCRRWKPRIRSSTTSAPGTRRKWCRRPIPRWATPTRWPWRARWH